MATMATDIKLNSMASLLSEQEWIQFISTVCARWGRSWLVTNLQSACVAPVGDVIQLMTDILHARVILPVDTDNSRPRTLLELSAPVIGHIASYLQQTGYAALELANRSAYLACNEPNTLRRISLPPRIALTPRLPLHKYNNLTSISLCLRLACSLPISSLRPGFAHVKSVTLVSCSNVSYTPLSCVLRFISLFPATQRLGLFKCAVNEDRANASTHQSVSGYLPSLPLRITELSVARLMNNRLVSVLLQVYASSLHTLKCKYTGFMPVLAQEQLQFPALHLFDTEMIGLHGEHTLAPATYIVRHAPRLHIFKAGYSSTDPQGFFELIQCLVVHETLQEVGLRVWHQNFAQCCRGITQLVNTMQSGQPLQWHCTLTIDCRLSRQELRNNTVSIVDHIEQGFASLQLCCSRWRDYELCKFIFEGPKMAITRLYVKAAIQRYSCHCISVQYSSVC